MTRSFVYLFLYQVLVVFAMLTFVSLGFVLAWALFTLQEPGHKKRPGLNIREF